LPVREIIFKGNNQVKVEVYTFKFQYFSLFILQDLLALS